MFVFGVRGPRNRTLAMTLHSCFTRSPREIRRLIVVWRLPPSRIMQSLLHDLDYAARMFHRQLGFTVVAPMTIAMDHGHNRGFQRGRGGATVVAGVLLTDRPVGVKKVANPTEVGADTSERNLAGPPSPNRPSARPTLSRVLHSGPSALDSL